MGDAAVPDMTMAPPDLTTADLTAPPGVAEFVFADVVGSLYTPTDTPIPMTHLFLLQQSTPALQLPAQYTDSDYTLAAGAVHGCIANRYDGVSAVPTPDENVGQIIYTGYNTQVTGSAPTGMGTPISTMINCIIPSGGANYLCNLGNDGNAVVAGAPTNGISFPLVPPIPTTGACPPTTTAFGTQCEQHLLLPTGGMQVQVNAPGGGSYKAIGLSAPGAGATVTPLHLLSFNGGPVGPPGDPLSVARLDPATDLNIVWNCDQTSTIPGQGCPTGVAGFTQLVGLFVATSTKPRSGFSLVYPYGQLICLEQLGSATSTLTVRAAAASTLLGNMTVGNGSYYIAMVSVQAALTSSNAHTVVLGVGTGNYSFVNY
jgi:hypothetical protein